MNIYIKNNTVHIGRDDNSTKPVSNMKKSRTQNIENKNNYMHARFSETRFDSEETDI